MYIVHICHFYWTMWSNSHTLRIPKSLSKQYLYQLKRGSWNVRSIQHFLSMVKEMSTYFKKFYFIGHVSSGEKGLKMWYQTECMAETSKHPADLHAKYSELYIQNGNLKLSEGPNANSIMRLASNSKITCWLKFVHMCF
jgi:hypothetical protein